MSESSQETNLQDEIGQYRKQRTGYGLVLIVVGLLGIVLPIIPGLLVMGFGLSLLFPRTAEKVWKRIGSLFRDWKK